MSGTSSEVGAACVLEHMRWSGGAPCPEHALPTADTICDPLLISTTVLFTGPTGARPSKANQEGSADRRHAPAH